MFDHQLNCAACGEKLSAAASACPRCGALRSVAVTDEAQAAGVGAPSEKAEAEPSTPPPQSPRAPGCGFAT
jgi:predicted amidophosphoribosyltransferase